MSIEIKDTIDFKLMLDDMSEMCDSSNKLMSVKVDELVSLVDKYGRRLNSIPRFREKWVSYMKILEDNKNSKYEDLLSILSVAETKSENLTEEDRLVEASVKYRIKELGELKLKSLNFYIDYDLKSILFSEKDQTPDKYNQYQKQVSVYSSTIENNYKVINAATELIELINNNMK